jgi:arylsulfatase A-like enzyme
MPSSPFDKLNRKPRLQACLLGLKRALLRPFKPNRIKPDRGGPANLLLLGIDTLRADHLGLMGYDGGPTSPCLDQLAAGGTIFNDTTAPAPWTLPSFTSALTGVMPGLHGGFLTGDNRNMDQQPPGRLSEGIVTLAAHLKQQGYRTAAFYSNQFFAFGLAESFDHHQYLNLPAAELSEIAQDWIRQNADQPFFCFILFNDPHEPTTPSLDDLSPFLSKAADPSHLADFACWGQEPHQLLGQMTDPNSPSAQAALKTKLALYDATIRSVDRVIGELQQQLQRWQLADSTLVSMFADHGEEFLDHVEFARRWNHDPRDIRGIGHGHTQFQELLHVPWAAWGPGVPAGVRRRESVSLCDLSPTVLDWLDLPPMQQPTLHSRLESLSSELRHQLQGRSLAASSTAVRDDHDRTILAEAIAYGPDLVVVRQGRWKMIAQRNGVILALFDLLSGPGELIDVQIENQEVVKRLQEVLQQWRESGVGAGGDDSNPNSWNDMDETVRQRLRDLGYSD